LEASATAYSEIGRTTLPIHGLDRLLRIGCIYLGSFPVCLAGVGCSLRPLNQIILKCIKSNYIEKVAAFMSLN
jgi:hypothetical protein